MDKRGAYFFALQFAEALGYGLERTMHVGLDDDVECGNLTGLNLAEDIFELYAALHTGIAALVNGAETLFARFGNGARCFFVRRGAELVASIWHCTQAENLHWRRRAGFFDLLTLVVDNCANFAPRGAGNHWVANFQCSLVDQHSGNWATTDIKLRFEHDALGAARWVGRKFFNFGNNVELLEQVVDA